MKSYQITVSDRNTDLPEWWQSAARDDAQKAMTYIMYDDRKSVQTIVAHSAAIARSIMGLVESDYDGDGSCDYVDRDTLYLQQYGRAYRWKSIGDPVLVADHHVAPVRLLTDGFNEAPSREQRLEYVLGAISGFENMDSHEWRRTYPELSTRIREAGDQIGEICNIAWEALRS